ncbi:MAG: hypothetical protein JNM72_03910 [Deltaproteobacteria bacterium]|nr:hypothetical protein [Deltaproteobacteria bacterium]
MRALLGVVVISGCAQPAVKVVCPAGATLGEDGRCYVEVAVEDTGGEGGGLTEEPGPPLPDLAADDITPAYDSAGLVAALDDALQHGLPTPADMIEPYLAIMAEGDPYCPGQPNDLDGRWLLGCLALSGAYYSGIAFWEQDLRAGHNEGLSGDFRLKDSEGYTLEVGGAAGWSISDGVPRGGGVFAHGSVLWERDSRWMGEVLSWSWDGEFNLDERSIVLRGSFGFRSHYISFENALLTPTCRGGSGVLRLRDPNGPWHELDYGGACAPCAVHRFPGQPDDEVCYDLSPLVEPLLTRLEGE